MTVPVDLADLAAALQRFGSGYLLTVGEDLRPHAVGVHARVEDGVLRLGTPGRRTRANLEARPQVSLLWPPLTAGDYSLIVDARAEVVGAEVVLAPEHAVLHRPGPAAPPGPAEDASAAADEPSCGNDCVPVGRP